MDRIGPYEIRGELGRGGAGVVYRAHDPRLRRDVAIKTLLDVDASPTQLRRFGREARALAQLRHPNIVAVHEVGEDAEGRPYLVMDLVEGITLEDRLAGGGPLDPREAAGLAQKIAEGLAAGHAQGILHRDVKPENIILTPDGEPHLTDYGLAKDLSSSQSGTVSIKGRYIGTPGFWSPEQASGDEEKMGPATDVYGLGATLFAMLTGRPVFETKRLTEAIIAALSKRPDAPSEVRDAIPEELDEIVLRCLEKEPGERYADGRELAETVGRFLKGESVAPVSTQRRGRFAPVEAETDRAAAPARVPRGQRRSGAGALVAAAMGFAFVGGALGATFVFAGRHGGGGGSTAERLEARATYLQSMLDQYERTARGLEERLTDSEAEARALRDEIAALRRAGGVATPDRTPESGDGPRLPSANGGATPALSARPNDPSWSPYDPTNVALLEQRGAESFERGDLESAVESFTKAIALDPGLARIWHNRGAVRRRQGDLDEAIADLSKAIELEPTLERAWFLRGCTQGGRGAYAMATADLTRSIELAPEAADAWRVRGAVKGALRDWDGALTDLERSLELDSTDPEAWFNFGVVTREKGELTKALAAFEEAARLGLQDPRVGASIADIKRRVADER